MSESSPQLPAFTSWPTFPFEGDLKVKRLQDPVAVEPPRHGDNPAECRACSAPDESYIWISERWRVRSLDRPTGLPAVLILESRSHLDLGDLPNMLAAELGVMTVRLERAMRSLDGVARVHVNRWGDGAAHLHVWFLARPYGRLQLQGTFLSLWDDILPTIPEDQWRENLALVAAWLAEFGGRPLAEPPHINWKSPSRFNEVPEPVPAPVAADEPGVTVSGDAGAQTDDEADTQTVGAADNGAADNGAANSGAANSGAANSGAAKDSKSKDDESNDPESKDPESKDPESRDDATTPTAAPTGDATKTAGAEAAKSDPAADQGKAAKPDSGTKSDVHNEGGNAEQGGAKQGSPPKDADDTDTDAETAKGDTASVGAADKP